MRGRSVFFFWCVFFACAGVCFSQGKAPAKEKLAAESGIGAALLLGDIMGISAKLWISEVSALDAGAGWSLYRRTETLRTRGAPYAYIEYMRHFFNEVKTRTGKFVYFVGVGVEYAHNYYEDKYTDKLYYGVRLPFGLSYMFENSPFDIFLETTPSIVFYFHGVTSDMGACVGLRYWFR